MPLSAAEKVEFCYGKELPILRGLDLAVEAGEILAVVGATGSGKSTLLKLLSGLLVPQKGVVWYDGKPVNLAEREERIRLARSRSMTFQLGGLFDSWTCAENVEFPLRELSECSQTERKKRVQRGLAEVGLAGVEKLSVTELSGGMQKRLALARSLVLEPRCLFLDDPTAGLDPVTGRTILDLIASLRKERDMTVVLVTSEIARMLEMVDRVALLTGGKIVESGNPREMNKGTLPLLKAFAEGRSA